MGKKYDSNTGLPLDDSIKSEHPMDRLEQRYNSAKTVDEKRAIFREMLNGVGIDVLLDNDYGIGVICAMAFTLGIVEIGETIDEATTKIRSFAANKSYGSIRKPVMQKDAPKNNEPEGMKQIGMEDEMNAMVSVITGDIPDDVAMAAMVQLGFHFPDEFPDMQKAGMTPAKAKKLLKDKVLTEGTLWVNEKLRTALPFTVAMAYRRPYKK